MQARLYSVHVYRILLDTDPRRHVRQPWPLCLSLLLSNGFVALCFSSELNHFFACDLSPFTQFVEAARANLMQSTDSATRQSRRREGMGLKE